ncbi:MAG: diguanylate cyclase, partial [Chloroflexota bacterium]
AAIACSTSWRFRRVVVRAFAGALRSGDSAVRYGGEEFAVILRGASADQAAEVADRLRRVVGTLDAGALGVPGRVTVSVGAALAGPDDDPVAVVRRADAALYAAKAAGRDRVAVA